MSTRALGALLAAAAAVLFVVSIVTSAWWDGHPRVAGHVMTAKDVHIGLLGGQGCNTGGTGECQPVELGSTFTAAAYGELGAVGLATAFVILVAGAIWRISDGRKGLAKASMVVTLLAAGGAGALIVIGPEIKSSATVEVPIGWGMFLFGGGLAVSLLSSVIARRIEREPIRLKTYAKPPPDPAFDVREILREQHDGLRPGASGQLVAGAPQLRPLYDHQGAVPAHAVPVMPERAPTPLPRASAHAFVGLPTPPPELVPPPLPPPSAAMPFAQPLDRPPTPSQFAETLERPQRPTAPPQLDRPKSPTAPPPPPPFVPSVAPYNTHPPERPKPLTAPPPPVRGRPPSVAPFANPAIDRSKSPSAAPPNRPSVNVDASADPLGKTMPAPGKPPGRPVVPKPAEPAARTSAPTLAHAVPPMPQIDTPPPQLRAPTDADDRLETAMRETDFITAVEIEHEAKARYEEQRRHSEGRAETASEGEPTGVSDPPQPELPRTTSEERAAIHDEGMAPHAHGDVPGDDTDSIETAARERIEADGLDPVAAPPPQKPPEPVKPPISTAPASLPPPKTANLPASGPTPACPQCESPMAWVEEHLRFYCKSCRMYF